MRNHRPNDETVTAWTRLARAYARLLAEIEGALKAAGLPPLAWYDVLLELHRERDSGLRQFEIGSRVLLPKHNLSRLLDRLENQKLVRRRACSTDGRGNTVQITDSGSVLVKRMWSVYGAVLHDRLECKLDLTELSTLGTTLDKLVRQLDLNSQ